MEASAGLLYALEKTNDRIDKQDDRLDDVEKALADLPALKKSIDALIRAVFGVGILVVGDFIRFLIEGGFH